MVDQKASKISIFWQKISFSSLQLQNTSNFLRNLTGNYANFADAIFRFSYQNCTLHTAQCMPLSHLIIILSAQQDKVHYFTVQGTLSDTCKFVSGSQ